MAKDNIEKIKSSSIQLSSRVIVVGSAIIATPQVSHIQILVVDNKLFWERLETACKAAGWVAVVMVAVAIYRSADPSKWKDNPIFLFVIGSLISVGVLSNIVEKIVKGLKGWLSPEKRYIVIGTSSGRSFWVGPLDYSQASNSLEFLKNSLMTVLPGQSITYDARTNNYNVAKVERDMIVNE